MDEDAVRTAAALSQLWVSRGLVAEARTWLERALERADHVPVEIRAKTLRWLGLVSTMQGDYDRGRAVLEEALDLYRSLGSEPGLARTLLNLGYLASESGEPDRAREWLDDAIERFTNLQQEEDVASAGSVLALALAQLGEIEAAIALTERTLAHERSTGDELGQGLTLMNLAHLLLQHGAHERAEIILLEGTTILTRLDERGFLLDMLDIAAQTAAFQGNHERAARLLGAADRAHEESGTAVAASEKELHHRAVESTREALGAGPFQVAWDMGTRMSLEGAIDLVLGAQTRVR
jgi:tetratricopeptide (TPR) repeat protein